VGSKLFVSHYASGMLRVFVLCLATLGLPAVAEELRGSVRVVDGDTIEVGRDKVRLFGIDAVEKDQTCQGADGRDFACGRHVTDWLRNFVGTREAVCDVRDRDRYGRFVAVCRVGGDDLGGVLVSAGLTTAYRRYSRDYVAQETAARAAGLGFWAGEFQAPARYRQERIVGHEAPGACRIKGNISKNGRIYHMPGEGSYARTGIRPEKGERWFCSEADALAAGWRRAGG